MGIAYWTVTDAHCHPTDLDITSEEYDQVKLGGIGAMATVPEDQDKVMSLGGQRGWQQGESSTSHRNGARVVSCFGAYLSLDLHRQNQGAEPAGYHPWFTHRYTLRPDPPTKEEHYRSIFFQPGKQVSERNAFIFDCLLSYLPKPLPFAPLLETLRQNISASLGRGKLTMLGEVGLDGGARMRWPQSARHLYEERQIDSEVEDDDEWTRLTPFKVSMEHQKAIVEAQIEVAVDLGVNVSFHSVSAAGT